ncbi:hypothetical protein Rhe02_40000 [Rhizocola hellebori]|uniref:Uncharacterized protein n=1 Tax=Rhizocola hellebori TaxID=1392758 RepID=A0A8J3QA27_9ACTN|nr:hypothetical protein [Rhizocola hellebori]GIH05933.1 hypothetical protein Rhe02_40000 [Rhizocola hellebori]
MTQDLRAGLAELAGEARSVDLRDRVLRGSRRLALRQRVIGAGMASVALAGVVGVLVLIGPGGDVKPPIGSPTPTVASPSPSASPTPSPEPVPPVDIRNASFVVPAFPETTDCPAGLRKFVDGRVDVDPNASPQETSLMLDGKPTMADVDGKPGAEILTVIWCRGYVAHGQVLALEVSPTGELSPLGFVLRSPDHQSFEVDSDKPIVVRDGVVEVTVLSPIVPDGGHYILDMQVRAYRFQNGSFSQVGGPTKFANPPSDPAKTDMANATVKLIAPGGLGFVKLVNGSGIARFGENSYSVTMVRSEFIGSGEQTEAVVLYRLVDQVGTVSETIAVYTFRMSPVPGDYLFIGVASGQDGIAHVQTFDAVGSQVKVTVELAGGGTEVRTYRKKVNELRWERLS